MASPTSALTIRWPISRRRITLRRRKQPYIRLGGSAGKNKGQTARLLYVKILKKLRLRWLKLKYARMLMKLKQVYVKVVKDLVEAGTAMESLHHQVCIESSFALPITGVSFANYPSAPGLNYR